MSSPVRSVKWLPLSALTLGVALALVLAALSDRGAASGPLTGSVTGWATPALPRWSVPAGYHIVYRVSAPGAPTTTEAVWVERPFDSFDEALAGEPPGGDRLIVTIDRLGARVVGSGTQSRSALIRVPASAPADDFRPDAVLDAMRRSGVARIVGHQKVLGRSCWLVRTAVSPRTAGPLPRLGNGSDHVDSCLGADGLILSERTVRAGRFVELRQAVSVEVGAAAGASGDYQMPAEKTAFNQGGGSFQALTPDSRPPGISWALPAPPKGFRFFGRFAVIPSQPQVFSEPDNGPPNDLGLPGGLVTELDDVYVNGPDLIVIQQGETLNGARFKPVPGGTTVDLGPRARLGPAQLTVSGSGSTITAEPTGGVRFVKVSGTVSPSWLVELARALRVQPPGQLVTRPGPSA